MHHASAKKEQEYIHGCIAHARLQVISRVIYPPCIFIAMPQFIALKINVKTNNSNFTKCHYEKHD